MIHKSLFLIVLILFSASTLWAGEINSVISDSNQLRIQLTGKPNYKIIPQDDPFKLRIELIDTKPGILSKKMLFHEGVVSEVSAQASNSGSVLEVLLSEPARAEIATQGNVLLVSFGRDIKTQEKLARIIDISIEKTEEGYEISIKGDNALPEPEVIKEADTINLAFSDVSIATEPSKEIPVNLKKQGEDLILSFPFGKEAETEVLYLGDEVVLDVKAPVKKQEVKVATKDVVASSNSKKSQAKSEKIEITPLKQTAGEKTISLDLQDADIVGALRLLAETGGYNLVLHPNVRGKISLKLTNVTIRQAFDMICKNYNLIQLEDENIIRIVPADAYLVELALEKRVAKVYKLKYVRPSEIIRRTEEIRTALADARIFQFFNIDKIELQEQKDKIDILFPYKVTEIKEKTETERTIRYKTATEEREEKYVKIIGIAIDERTGSLIINAPSSLQKIIYDVIAKLDLPQKQVLFEARIIEVSSSFSKSLGFEWGIRWSPPDSRTNIIGSQAGTMPGGSTPIAVNLPASTGNVANASSAITIGYLNAAGTFALDLRISALQQSGKGKVIAQPRIIVLDNQVARITQGERIPYPEKVITETGFDIATAFLDIGINLALTPRLIDDYLNVYITFEKEELIGFLEISPNLTAPQTVKLSGNTEVKVKDGETLVLGGIYKKVESITDSKVPGLGDIPLVGELFTKRGRDENIYEVLIFITPRIIKE